MRGYYIDSFIIFFLQELWMWIALVYPSKNGISFPHTLREGDA